MKLAKIITLTLCLQIPLSHAGNQVPMNTNDIGNMTINELTKVTTDLMKSTEKSIKQISSEINKENGEILLASFHKKATNLITTAGLTAVGCSVLGLGFYNLLNRDRDNESWYSSLMHKSTGGALLIGSALMYVALKMVK